MSPTTTQQRLCSALRTVLACTIVGCTTLYGPDSVRRLVTFPAFSYVTTILIVSDSTLGDTLKGCRDVVYATFRVMVPCTLGLWVVGPARFGDSGGEVAAAVAVVVFCFLVGLGERTELLGKRIGFGQVVIVFVGLVNGDGMSGGSGLVMHPVHVVASTFLAVLASLLAMLLPFPHLANREVRKTFRLYVENALQRFNLYVEAISAQDKTAALNLASQAKCFYARGVKLLQSIKDNQEGILWEKPGIRLAKTKCLNPRDKIQSMEIPIRGMDIALSSCPSFPITMIDDELRRNLQSLKIQIGFKLEQQAKCSMPFDSTKPPETKGDGITEKSVYFDIEKTLDSMSTKDLPVYFFQYGMELLLQDDSHSPFVTNPDETILDAKTDIKITWCNVWQRFITRWFISRENLVFALKCSVSLGLAVLFGLLYDKRNGYWSGLIIAISFVTGRQATFTVANARAQGTAMGSIYGILCSFIFHKMEEFRFISLLPWIVFASFLRHSRMYGQPGGISAVIGALLILGRKNYGTPTEFAIARITEASIGLLCFVFVEVLFRPVRAATLAKAELSNCLGLLHDCIECIVLNEGNQNSIKAASNLNTFKETHKKLMSHAQRLEDFIAEANMEPNFWFLPFQGDCYAKILASLLKMADLLLFMSYQVEFLSRTSHMYGFTCKHDGLQEECMINDIELFKEKVNCSLKCLKDVTLIKSITLLEDELKNKTISHDIESGRSPNERTFTYLGLKEEDVEEIDNSLLRHLKEAVGRMSNAEGQEKLKKQMVLSVCGLGFCISSFMKETIEIREKVNELVKWENPNRHISLYEISCKLHAMNKNQV